ncbi:MAG: DNA translocase FtsK 4TM domain-containing protein, partial [Atopobiaceae bacterium]|nr:DNA translocase FtsK 4TM domain-containing protein [Atopobiaceae bacterium]
MAKRKTTSKRSNTRAKKAPAQPLRLTGTANDIVGLLLVVLAVALMVALLLPSSAPVTRTCGEVLVLCFGSGALLFPAALLAFALTFFTDEQESVSGKVAFGLALAILAVLSIVSITCPGAEQNSAIVLDHEVLRERGGYAGGGIAWALLQTVGREVGLVILIGTVIAGVVICGFSISDTVTKVRSGVGEAAVSLQEANERRRARREERRAQRAAMGAYDDYDDYPADGYEEPKTTYPDT